MAGQPIFMQLRQPTHLTISTFRGASCLTYFSRAQGRRLMMTEEAYFSSLAQRDCFAELGVEQFEIVATLDSHTSEICQELDGTVRPMSEFEPGVTAPPFHVNCRSTTVPYFDDEFSLGGERAARGRKWYNKKEL